MTLTERWSALWAALHLEMPDDAQCDRMLARYAEPHRAYHTAQHLEECLGWLDEAASTAEAPRIVELALWYHDAVYEPRRDDNEQASAELARLHLEQGGAGPQVIDDVCALIRWTEHATEPPSGDPALTVDIDLAVLGSPAPRFAEYEQQIRREYDWVPLPIFRRRRAALLEGFLDRGRIYSTPLLHDRLEQQAHANITAAIRKLRS
jgi:predicted metal-dependent HD superfamily phosphohydrolase